MVISKFGLVVICSFAVILVFSKILVPFGDEPDYLTKVKRLNNDEKFILSPVRLMQDIYSNIQEEHECKLSSGSTSLWASIDHKCLELNAVNFLPKYIFTIFLVLPILMFIVFRRALYNFSLSSRHIQYDVWNARLDALSLSIIFPSLVYLLGLISEEVVVTVASLFIFLFWKRPIIIFLILSLVYFIDDGNFYVAFIFVLMLFFNMQINRYFGAKVLLYSLLAGICIAYFFGGDVIAYLGDNNLQGKFKDVNTAIAEKSAFDNYLLIIRPFMTVMSFIFMTSSGVKSLALYILVGLSIVFVAWKSSMSHKNVISACESQTKPGNEREFDYAFVGFVTALFTIICFVFSVPTHAYAKYYIFLMPYILYFLLYFVGRWAMLRLFYMFSSVLYINLMIYYI